MKAEPMGPYLSDDPADWNGQHVNPYKSLDLEVKHVDPPTPRCPKCDASMSFKGKGKFGEWWGCDKWKSTGCKGSMNDEAWKKAQSAPTAESRARSLFPEE